MTSIKKNTITDHRRHEKHVFDGPQDRVENQNFLIFLLQCDTFELKGYNLQARNRLASELEKVHPEGSFIENQIHPEDLLEFRSILQHIEKDGSENEFTIDARLRSGAVWTDYNFKIRQYQAPISFPNSPTADKQDLLRAGEDVTNYRKDPLGKLSALSHKQKGKSTLALCVAQVRMVSKKTTPRKHFDAGVGEILYENRNKYSALIEAIDEGYATIDLIYDTSEKPRDYLFLETNPAFENHVTLEKTDGYTIKELAPAFEDQWLEHYGSVAHTGQSKRFTHFSRSLSNTWFNVFAFPIGDQYHRKVGVIFSNITETKNTERKLIGRNETLERRIEKRNDELKENAALLQIVFDTTNEGLLVLEPIRSLQNEIVDFRYLRANKVMETLQGETHLEGRRYLDINPHAASNGLLDVFKDVMQKGVFRDFEFWCELENKPGSWYRITTRRQADLLIISMEDITQRKMEAERLKENIRFKKQLAHTSPDLIIIFDLRREKIKYLNRNLSSVAGMRRKEVLGKNIEEIFSFVHPRDRDRLMNFHEKIVSGTNDNITDTEFRLRGEKKEWEWYSVVGKVFKRNLRGSVCEYIILLRNIDEQKATQKALLRAEKLSIKGEVARTFAHELRNPLASIGMATDILRQHLPQEQMPQLENYLGIIRRSTKMLNKLVTDLLTSSNYTPAVLQKTCLAKILEETLTLASDRIYLSGIKVVKKYKSDYFINADGEKLKIALLNIIINASEAMHPDQGILRLKIEKKEDWFILMIKDNGHGLEKEQLEKLFDAFYTQKPGGMGVGLNSVKNILEEHDAEIAVTSTPKKGTQFELSFPCYQFMKTNFNLPES